MGSFAENVPELLADAEAWTIDLETERGSVAHANPIPGCTFLRIEMVLELQNMPLDCMQHVLLRPEVYAKEPHLFSFFSGKRADIEILEQIAPGDAVIKGPLWQLSVIFTALFGNAGHLPSLDLPWRRTFLRDVPEAGDCLLLNLPCDQAFRSLSSCLHCRDLRDGTVKCTYVLQVPFPLDDGGLPTACMEMLQHGLDRLLVASACLNDSSRPRLAATSRDYYVVLTVRSCRFAPLLPADVETADIEVNSATGWTTYWKHDKGRAHMSGYLEDFFNHLFPGKQLRVYASLDGHQLARYQCAITREDWDFVKPAFDSAFMAQRSAYRRAYGGSSGPSVVDTLPPKRLGRSSFSDPQEMPMEQRDILVVRKTFIEIEDPNNKAFVQEALSFGRRSRGETF